MLHIQLTPANPCPCCFPHGQALWGGACQQVPSSPRSPQRSWAQPSTPTPLCPSFLPLPPDPHGHQTSCITASAASSPSTVISGCRRQALGSAAGSLFPPCWRCGCLALLFASSCTFNMCGQTQALECNSVQGKSVGACSTLESRNS